MTLQTVGAYGHGIHSTWVSYMTRSQDGQWLHTTIWQVPAHTRIDVTIYQYDSGSPLRNQQIGMVQGTLGGVATSNGKTFSVINSNAGNGVGHTFSMPSLGINVPSTEITRTRICAAPLRARPPSPHNIIKFSFMSPGPGSYPWQCFVPCALGFLYGNGGPDADGRLHGRLHEGGRLMPGRPVHGEAPRAGSRRRARPVDGTQSRMAHLRDLGGAVRHSRSALLLPRRAPHPSRDDEQHGRRGAVRLQHPFHLRPAGDARGVDLHGLRHRQLAGLAGGPGAGRRPEGASNLPIQITWIVVTTVLVLFLFGFGTYELVQPGGRRRRAGTDADLDADVARRPADPGHRPAVEVDLPLPDLRRVRDDRPRRPGQHRDRLPRDLARRDPRLLGLPARREGRRQPRQDNVAFTTTPDQLGSFVVRCDELCGLWHGAMYNYGKVVTPAQFQTWAEATERQLAANTKFLPPFAWTYTPDANGADGGYYPDNVDPYSPWRPTGPSSPANRSRPTK